MRPGTAEPQLRPDEDEQLLQQLLDPLVPAADAPAQLRERGGGGIADDIVAGDSGAQSARSRSARRGLEKGQQSKRNSKGPTGRTHLEIEVQEVGPIPYDRVRG